MGSGALKDIKSAYRVAVKGLVRDELGMFKREVTHGTFLAAGWNMVRILQKR